MYCHGESGCPLSRLLKLYFPTSVTSHLTKNTMSSSTNHTNWWLRVPNLVSFCHCACTHVALDHCVYFQLLFFSLVCRVGTQVQILCFQAFLGQHTHERFSVINPPPFLHCSCTHLALALCLCYLPAFLPIVCSVGTLDLPCARCFGALFSITEHKVGGLGAQLTFILPLLRHTSHTCPVSLFSATFFASSVPPCHTRTPLCDNPTPFQGCTQMGGLGCALTFILPLLPHASRTSTVSRYSATFCSQGVMFCYFHQHFNAREITFEPKVTCTIHTPIQEGTGSFHFFNVNYI